MNPLYPDDESYKLLTKCIRSTEEILSTIHKIKEKRKVMNDTNTPVTDEMVKEFLKTIPSFIYHTQLTERWEKFKSKHSSSGRAKELLNYKTTDGKPVYLGDENWCVDLSTWIITKDYASPITENGWFENYALFSTRAAAEDYVNLNKPVLTVSDIHTILMQLSQVFERDINKYTYNEELKKYVFRLAHSKINRPTTSH